MSIIPGEAIVIGDATDVGVAMIEGKDKRGVVLMIWVLTVWVKYFPENALVHMPGLLRDCRICWTRPLSSTWDAGVRTKIEFCPYLLSMSAPNKQIAARLPTMRRSADPFLFWAISGKRSTSLSSPHLIISGKKFRKYCVRNYSLSKRTQEF